MLGAGRLAFWRQVVEAGGATYSYYRPLSIDHLKVSGSSLSNYPLLVSGTYSYLASSSNGGKVSHPEGFDLLFASDTAGTPLPFELVRWNPTNGDLVAWVNVPTISGLSDTTIFLHYGYADASGSAASTNAAWRSDFSRVWHLDISGSVLNVSESTVNNGHLTNFSSLAASSSMKVNGGARVGVNNRYLTATRNDTLPAITGSWSIHAWIDATPHGGSIGRWLSWNDGTTNIQSLFFSSRPMLNVKAGSGDSAPEQSPALGSFEGMSQLVFTYDGVDTYKTYINGVDVTDNTYTNTDITSFTTNNTTLYIGQRGNGSYLNSTIDELWLLSSALSADEAATWYNNHATASAFYTLGSEVST